MTEQTKTKHVPVISIIAGVFLFLHLIVFIVCFVAFFTQSYSSLLLIILPIVPIISLVFAIVSRRDRIKKLHFAFLFSNISFLLIGGLAYLMGSFQAGIMENRAERERITREKALNYSNVEYIKTLLPPTNYLFSNRMIGTDVLCIYDTDGAIVNQFVNMEFTLTDKQTTSQLLSFYHDNLCTVSFFGDYTGLVVESHVDGSGIGYGHIYYEYKNIYSCDPREGEKIRDLITGAIGDQIQAFNNLKASITIESVINEFEKEDALKCQLKTTDDNGYSVSYLEIDFNRVVLNDFKQIDSSKVTYFEPEETLYIDPGFNYSNYVQPDYYVLSYNSKSNFIKIVKNYQEVVTKSHLTVTVYYHIDQEDGATLMSVADTLFYNYR